MKAHAMLINAFKDISHSQLLQVQFNVTDVTASHLRLPALDANLILIIKLLLHNAKLLHQINYLIHLFHTAIFIIYFKILRAIIIVLKIQITAW